MKLLFINATYGVGSTGVIVRDLCMLAKKHGWECHVAASNISQEIKKFNHVYGMGNQFDHKLHGLLSRIHGKQAYYSMLPTLRLIRYIDKIKPDVVHLHNLHSNFIHLNLLLKHLAKINTHVVVTLHDCWFFTGGCFHYTNAHCNKWQSTCGQCPKKLQDTPAYLGDRSSQILKDRYKYFDKIKDLKVVGVSAWIAEESQKSVFRGRDVCVIHNGVDMEVFKPTGSDIRSKLHIEDKFVVLGPATKWLDETNAAALSYFAKNLQEDECLILFGCKNKRNDLPPSIIQYGFTTSREELAALYSTADVFVNLTHEDSLSFINLEAQACGTRVLTYGNTGAKETVDGVYSKSVETDDFISMLNEVRKMKASKHKIGIDCVEFIRRNFEKHTNYEKYLKLYKSF